MQYRRTEIYTVEQFVDMGVEWNRVLDSYGMIIAVLTHEEFAKQYELVLDQVSPEE